MNIEQRIKLLLIDLEYWQTWATFYAASGDMNLHRLLANAQGEVIRLMEEYKRLLTPCNKCENGYLGEDRHITGVCECPKGDQHR